MHEYLNSMVRNTVKHILQKQEPWSIFCSGLQSALGSPCQNLAAAARASSASAVCGKHRPPSRTFGHSHPPPPPPPRLSFPPCAFLPVTPLAMTKLSSKHKTFSQRGGAIGFGVRNAQTRLPRAALGRAEP